MTDNPHPDLAGLVAAPLLSHERMGAAAARLHRIAAVLGDVLEARLFTRVAAAMADAADLHKSEPCPVELAGLGPCKPQLLADAVLDDPS